MFVGPAGLKAWDGTSSKRGEEKGKEVLEQTGTQLVPEGSEMKDP